MASRRISRLNEQLKREISHLLRTQVHDPRVVGITVTDVKVSPDLTVARVWIYVSGDEERRETALAGMGAAGPFIRRQLGAILRVRRIPELEFQEDRTLERALRIEALLREVRSEPESAESAESAEPQGDLDPEEPEE